MRNFFFNKTKEKTGDREQREQLESDVTEVASQTEESPSCTLADDNEPTQSKENSQEDTSSDTQQTVSQSIPARTCSGQGRSPKTTPVFTPEMLSIKKEEEIAVQNVPEFQDDPSDTDYMPSKCIFLTE